MNTSASNRKAKLALALRENLKRRKRQTREREKEMQVSSLQAALSTGQLSDQSKEEETACLRFKDPATQGGEKE